MNIEEIRARREVLESDLMAKFNKFREETGLCVVGCEIQTFELHPLESRDMKLGKTYRVTLNIEPI